MIRYLKAALLVQVPIPINAVVVALLLALALFHPLLAVCGLGAEVLLLVMISSFASFRALADKDFPSPAVQKQIARNTALLAALPSELRSRHATLEKQASMVTSVLSEYGYEPVLLANAAASLDKLRDVHFKLLVTYSHLNNDIGVDSIKVLERRIAALQLDIESSSGEKGKASGLARSQAATLALLGKRLENVVERDQRLKESGCNLQRIEDHILLMRENAALGGKPEDIESQIRFAGDFASADLFSLGAAPELATVDKH